MAGNGNFVRKHLDMMLIALSLMTLSALLALVHYLIFDDSHHISSYFLLHLAFLPMHALVLGLVLDELISYREKQARKKRLHMFLGIFFRQMGLDILLQLTILLVNHDELEEMMVVDKDWKHRQFKRAQAAVEAFKPSMRADRVELGRLQDLLRDKENDILAMTRNPVLLEFELLYGTLLSLFHMIEEMHFRGSLDQLPLGEVQHLARDAGKTLVLMVRLWLNYLEFLKSEHPVLFTHQVGLHNTITPIALSENSD